MVIAYGRLAFLDSKLSTCYLLAILDLIISACNSKIAPLPVETFINHSVNYNTLLSLLTIKLASISPSASTHFVVTLLVNSPTN